jgi:excinuclease UvrABC nuclease subunit
MLKNMHRGSVHTGKVPAKLRAGRLRSKELVELQASLQKAVEEEHFEEAAALRDKIRNLEEEVRAEEAELIALKERASEVNRIAASLAAEASQDLVVPKPRKQP